MDKGRGFSRSRGAAEGSAATHAFKGVGERALLRRVTEETRRTPAVSCSAATSPKARERAASREPGGEVRCIHGHVATSAHEGSAKVFFSRERVCVCVCVFT